MMPRSPGPPVEKEQLLASLDAASLPHLVADILAINYRHREVRVVDGPGDGRRDVHSVTPDGHRCVTQCKFHRDPTRSVSSRETDELPVALAKFGAKHGYFATTGRLSPQASREYLDNFPDYKILFFAGMDLVDEVLSNMSLRAAWLEHSKIEWAGVTVLYPVLLRDAASDLPIVGVEFGGHGLDVSRKVLDVGLFAPYRSPTQFTPLENGGAQVNVIVVRDPMIRSLHQCETGRNVILDRLRNLPEFATRTVVVRFGLSLLVRSDISTDWAEVRAYPPQTYVLTDKRVMSEFEWVVPKSDAWTFPSHISTLEEPWASWMRPDIDLWLRVELHSPKGAIPDPFHVRQLAAYRSECFGASLFFAGGSEACDTVCRLLDKKDQPDVRCPYGPLGVLLGWIHPHALSSGEGVLQCSASEWIDNPPNEVPEFTETLRRVAAMCTGLQPVNPKEAELTMEIAGANPLGEAEYWRHTPAELMDSFDELPSPILYRERAIIFVGWWRVPASLSEVADFLSTVKVVCQGVDELYFDVNHRGTDGDSFAMISFVFTGRPTKSTQEVVDHVMPSVLNMATAYGAALAGQFPGSVLASREFWTSQVQCR